MSGATKTRTQRRMEKRQAIILLVLVLAVSLVSFTLGVMIGRRGAEREQAYQQTQVERVLVAEAPAIPPAPEGAGSDAVDVREPDVAGVPVPEEAAEDPKLSFYEDISKPAAPLGSGINVALSTEKEAVQQPPIALPEQPIVAKAEPAPVKTVPEPKVAAAEVKQSASSDGLPAAVSGGSHAVQVGSFNAEKDARALQQKLLKQHYPAFVVAADLGAKGRWFRVRVGPYADAEAAKRVQKVLAQQENVKGFVSRQ